MDSTTLFFSAMEAYSKDEFQLAATQFGELFDSPLELEFFLSDEQLFQAYYSFAHLLYESHREYNMVLALLEKAIVLDPQIEHAYLLQGLCYKALTLYSESFSSIEQAISCCPRPEYYVLLADILECKGEPFEIVASFLKKALKLNPDYEEAHYLLGEGLFFEVEDFLEAEYHLVRAIEIDEGYGLAHNILGQLYKKKAVDAVYLDQVEFNFYLDKSITHLEKSIHVGDFDIFTFAHLHNSYWMKKNLRKAHEVGSEMIKRFPENAEAYWMYAQFCAETSSTTDFAEGLFKKAIELEPNCSDGYMCYGRALLNWERASEARLQFEQASILGESEAHFFLGDER